MQKVSFSYGIEPFLKDSHLKVVGDCDLCSESVARSLGQKAESFPFCLLPSALCILPFVLT